MFAIIRIIPLELPVVKMEPFDSGISPLHIDLAGSITQNEIKFEWTKDIAGIVIGKKRVYGV